MATNTHKFKKNYMEALIGNLDRHKDRYVTRSPLRNHERLEVPTIFFHGAMDKVRSRYRHVCVCLSLCVTGVSLIDLYVYYICLAFT